MPPEAPALCAAILRCNEDDVLQLRDDADLPAAHTLAVLPVAGHGDGEPHQMDASRAVA